MEWKQKNQSYSTLEKKIKKIPPLKFQIFGGNFGGVLGVKKQKSRNKGFFFF